jgi:ABC-type nitrate/sulfonate/bicarbonate transport system substrate-binding protein
MAPNVRSVGAPGRRTVYTQSKPFQHPQEATGKKKAIEDLSRYPDGTLQVVNIPAAITCTEVMAEKHPELVVTFMKSMIKVGRWANEHKRAQDCRAGDRS